MIIWSANFLKSSTSIKDSPAPDKPEFGFIGRSNVGKSSLINLLTGHGKLAKTSSEPGKTRTINHFLINDEWYLVDLPGYGYAKVSKKLRENWGAKSTEYILGRENLVCLFVLLDARLEPQKLDLDFLDSAGNSGIPIARIFTKTDKIKEDYLRQIIKMHDERMLLTWESLPFTFTTSTVNKSGREEILTFIQESINNYKKGSGV